MNNTHTITVSFLDLAVSDTYQVTPASIELLVLSQNDPRLAAKRDAAG